MGTPRNRGHAIRQIAALPYRNVGRGLRAPENFKLVEELADAFGNAAVGATRAVFVSPESWLPQHHAAPSDSSAQVVV